MVLCALEASRVIPVSGFCALVDTCDRTVHHVDFVAERDGRPCLVLVYYTQQRARATRDLDAIAQQCQGLRRLCLDQYAMPNTHVCAVNVHFIMSPVVGNNNDRLVGAWVIPSRLSTWWPQDGGVPSSSLSIRRVAVGEDQGPPPPPAQGPSTASDPPDAGPPPGSPPRTAP